MYCLFSLGVMLLIKMLADLLSGSAADMGAYPQRFKSVSGRCFDSTSYGAERVFRPQLAA
jgi:hypothetical protein